MSIKPTTKNQTTKDHNIMIRVPADLKKDFHERCEELSINPSAWLRKQIERFLQENKNSKGKEFESPDK